MRPFALASGLVLLLGAAIALGSTYVQRTYCGCEERPNAFGGSGWWSGYVLGREECSAAGWRLMWCDAAGTCEGRGAGFYDCR